MFQRLLRGFRLFSGGVCLVLLAMWVQDGALAAKASSAISWEEFRESRFANQFKKADYPAALEALDSLLERYPDDRLLLRYRAITLDRLGRTAEAIHQFQALLQDDPSHVPTRYFLALAYAQAGQADQARKEFAWVIEKSSVAEYRDWSRSGLKRLAVRPSQQQQWSLGGSAGWEFDSNVSLKPDDKALASAGDQNANRFSAVLQIGYRLLANPERIADLLYTARHSANNDSFDELNFSTQEAGFSTRRRSSFLGRPLILGGQVDSIVGFLRETLFSWANRLTLSADTRLTARTRTLLIHQLSWIDFGPDGSNPPQTSRDGLYQEISVTQFFYTADFRRHLFLSQGYAEARVRGGNFERRGTFSRLGVHIPVTGKLEADASAGFSWNRYPRFDSISALDRSRRRDASWDLYASLTYPLNPRLSSRTFYRFVRAENQNDFFEYDRHLFGVEFLF